MVNAREFEEYLEMDVTVVLKDNHYLYGTFKSYDQYNSITLNYVIERVFHEKYFAEKKQGLVVVRGESIVLLGVCVPSFTGLKQKGFSFLCKKIENKMVN